MARAKRAQVTKTTEIPAKAANFPAGARHGNGDAAPDMESTIRLRAYELYEKLGRQDGFALDDWFQAELEVKSRIAHSA